MSRKTHGQIYATGLYLSSSSTDFLFFPFYWRGSIYIIACVGFLYANECVSGLSQHNLLCSAKRAKPIDRCLAAIVRCQRGV